MTILITGGAGYIGSHTALSLLEHDRDIVIVDNLVNSSKIAIQRVEQLSGKSVKFYEGDVCNIDFLNMLFSKYSFESVIHFASLKSVSESVSNPLEYYSNNIVSMLSLIKAMMNYGVNNLIFSSSATVYGVPESIPLTESCQTGGTTNPYGSSKFFIEQILKDVSRANSKLNIMLLRYFNPVGAHSSGFLGEAPNGIPNNLFPYITQVAVGKLAKVNIYGDNYDTPDGTGVRDYIHVMDLAEGHLAALNAQKDYPGLRVYNLGTGKGYSVKEIVTAFKKITGVDIPYQITERRLGDIAECWSDPSLASHELRWNAKRGLNEMITDAWRWQQKNPAGYE